MQEYEPEKEQPKEEYFEDTRGKFAAEPRFKEMKAKAPGPTTYALPRFGDELDVSPSGCFKSSSERFLSASNDVPAAGSYHQEEKFLKQKSFRIERERAPFESSSSRFLN